jgi:hypothetical protein
MRYQCKLGETNDPVTRSLLAWGLRARRGTVLEFLPSFCGFYSFARTEQHCLTARLHRLVLKATACPQNTNSYMARLPGHADSQGRWLYARRERWEAGEEARRRSNPCNLAWQQEAITFVQHEYSTSGYALVTPQGPSGRRRDPVARRQVAAQRFVWVR